VLQSSSPRVPASPDGSEDIYGSDQWAAVMKIVKAKMTPAQLREWASDEARQDEAWFINHQVELRARTDRAFHNVDLRLRERAHLLRTLTIFARGFRERMNLRQQIAKADEKIEAAAKEYRAACSAQGVPASVLLAVHFNFDNDMDNGMGFDFDDVDACSGFPQYID
jgi:hypothetical protein